MKKILLATAIVALSISAAQAGYQVELGGGAATTNFEDQATNQDTDFNGVAIGGTLYFNEVKGNTGPLAEAAFIERASNIGTSLSYGKNNDFDIKTNNINIGGEFYVPNSDFYAAASYGRTSSEILGIEQDDVDGYSAQIGFLPMSGLLLTAGVVGTDTTSGSQTDPAIGIKYLTKAGINDFNIEGSAVFGDGADSYSVSSDLYLDRTFSVGASLNYSDVDLADNSYDFGVNARKFIAPNFSVQGSISVGETSFNDDTVGVQIGAFYRF